MSDKPLSAGHQRIAQSLQVTVECVAQEYARIAFAPVDDFDVDHGIALQATRLKLGLRRRRWAGPQPLQSIATSELHDVSPDISVVPLEKLLWSNHTDPGTLSSAKALRTP